jgi:hypothetical protein
MTFIFAFLSLFKGVRTKDLCVILWNMHRGDVNKLKNKGVNIRDVSGW